MGVLSGPRHSDCWRWPTPSQRDAWEQRLCDLPFQIEQAEAQGDPRYTTPAELREMLDRWSLAAQGRLIARSTDVGRALTAGASLIVKLV